MVLQHVNWLFYELLKLSCGY